MCVQAALELKAAHSVEVAACRQVVATQAQEVLRLKWQLGNANIAAVQLSQAYQQQHLLKMQASRDQRSMAALKREVRRSKWFSLASNGSPHGSATPLDVCVSNCVEWNPQTHVQHGSLVNHFPHLLGSQTSILFTAHKHCASYVSVACVAKHPSRVHSTQAM